VSFTGEFRRSIDEKGRLIVPSRLRDEIAGDSVILNQGYEPCISLWTNGGWGRFEQNLLAQPQSDPETRRLVRRLGSKGHTDQVDKQGRITVPQHLREYAGIEDDIVIVGLLDHAEIWDPERYAEEEIRQNETTLEEQIARLKI
jgi:MraZ protein